ncbi:MAG: DUF1232 domain-containing protein [Candidatus Obscuribacterales bacterium]|nr:DUF1232 domain-containing protein [Candidatus Obscuribacterales bacterium]
MILRANLKNNLWRQLSIQAKAVVIALDDRRLPKIVRLLFWFALIYFICPYDIKSDFLPGGFIDDSIIAPVLLLLAVVNIPGNLFRESKSLARSATAGMLCLVLLSSTQFLGDENELFSNADTTSAACAGSLKNQQVESGKEYKFSSQADLKNKAIESLLITRNFSADFAVANFPGQSTFLFDGLWKAVHGQQLQVYDSEDDPDSTSDDEPSSISLRPPFLRKGGLLHTCTPAFQIIGFLRPLHELCLVKALVSQFSPPLKLWLLNQILLS